jgi:hypothetical protein
MQQNVLKERLMNKDHKNRHFVLLTPDSRKWLIKHLFPPRSCKKNKQNKQNSYLLAFLQSGSVPELNMHESKHVLTD